MSVITKGNFTFESTPVDGVFVITPKVYGDARGYFMETYQYQNFKDAGLDMEFVQDNQSKSTKGVLRGLHFQTRNSQGKLVRVTVGEVWDVAVDIRKDSLTFGKYFGVKLSAENHKMFYIPEGLAHGFVVLSDEAEFVYKCTNYYDPGSEAGLMWNDPDLGIQWPVENLDPLLSEKDQKHPSFREYCEKNGITL